MKISRRKPPPREFTEINKKTTVTESPSDDEIMEMMEEGYCTTPDGCAVEPDGTCPHGQDSWAIIRGLI